MKPYYLDTVFYIRFVRYIFLRNIPFAHHSGKQVRLLVQALYLEEKVKSIS